MTGARARSRSPFRSRLTATFVAVVGVSCGVLAVATYWPSREYRTHGFATKARREATIHAAMAPRPLTDVAATRLARLFERVGGEDLVAVASDGQVASSSGFRLADVPTPLRRGATGDTARSTTVGGRPYLVVSRAAGGGRLFVFFDEAELTAGIHGLRDVLLAGWFVILVVSALVGGVLTRRTLAPVRAAGDAARAMAEGLLDTRLPVDSDDEFGRWARYFNEMAAALESKIAALRDAHAREVRFTADVAHELRTPLAAAVNAAAVVEGRLGELPPGLRRPVELMVDDVQRLRRLVLELLELSRLDAGQEAVATEVLSLPAVTEAVRAATPTGHVVVVDDEPVWVLADRRRIDRVLTNLVANAVEHGGPSVTVRVHADGDSGVVEVHDDGAGIPRDKHAAIFERFYKADASRSGGGVGLGLAIAVENARSMHGTLDVTSAPGEGTTFTLRLPLVHTNGSQSRTSTTPAGSAPRRPSSAPGRSPGATGPGAAPH